MGFKEVIQTYRTLGAKEFWKKFKEGVEGVSAVRQTELSIKSAYISLAGILIGIVVTAINWKSAWWVTIILIGGFGMLELQIIGMAQKLKALIQIEDAMKEANQTIEEQYQEVNKNDTK